MKKVYYHEKEMHSQTEAGEKKDEKIQKIVTQMNVGNNKPGPYNKKLSKANVMQDKGPSHFQLHYNKRSPQLLDH